MRQLVTHCAVIAIAFSGVMAQELSFDGPHYYGAGYLPYSVAAADLDGDGDNDLALANLQSNSVSILLNDGDGTFLTHVDYAVGNRPYCLSSNDLDGDGDADLVVSNLDDGDISVLMNGGDGTFQAAVDYDVGVSPHGVFTCDLDDDGDVDIAVTITLRLAILKNNGDGTFQPPSTYGTLNMPTSLHGSDLDEDGDIDLAVCHFNDVSVFKNDGNGTFQAAVGYDDATNEQKSVFLTDLDGDGFDDLAVAHWNSHYVAVLKNNGDATFQAPVNVSVGDRPTALCASDFDSDGDNDLAATHVTSADIHILRNDGSGSFQDVGSYGAHSNLSICASDLDGDGDKDLAASSALAVGGSLGSVAVLLNVTEPLPIEPHIELSTNDLAFEAVINGELPAPQQFTISNSGDGTLEWSVDEGLSGLEVTPAQGTGNSQEITVSITTTQLVPAIYDGDILVYSSNTDNSPQTVHVVYTVWPSHGTTVIVHGYKIDPGTSEDLQEEAGWTLSMATAIVNRLGAGAVYTTTEGDINETPYYQLNSGSAEGERVVVFDWVDESDREQGGYLEAAADALTAILIDHGSVPGGLLDLSQIHFIGHSRGAVVCSETIERLALYGEQLPGIDPEIHLTTLDPHPWDSEEGDCIGEGGGDAHDYDVNSDNIQAETGEPGQGPVPQAVVCWQNVGYADNYHQGYCGDSHLLPNGLHSFVGLNVNDRANVDLDNVWTDKNPLIYDHREVHAWYYGTVAHQAQDDGDGVDILVGYYPDDENLTFGFNIGRNFGPPNLEDFHVSPGARIAVSEDATLWAGKVFNGEFEHQNSPSTNDVPGWSLHGGGGEGVVTVTGSTLVLNGYYPRISHNPLYIPANATHVALACHVLVADVTPPIDHLRVLVDDQVLDEPFALDTQRPMAPLPWFPLSDRGCVKKLTLEVWNDGQEPVEAQIAVDDVRFIIDEQDRDEYLNKLHVTVGSPVDVVVTDPDGLSIGADASAIPEAEYLYYARSEGDTGVYVTVPDAKQGSYGIQVIPKESAEPTDTYSIHSSWRDKEITLAEDEAIANIPPGGYTYSITCCTGRVGDVNNSGDEVPTIGDISVLIDARFVTGDCGATQNPPVEMIACFGEADINGSGGTYPTCGDLTIGDISMLIDYLFITGPETFGPLSDCQ